MQIDRHIEVAEVSRVSDQHIFMSFAHVCVDVKCAGASLCTPGPVGLLSSLLIAVLMQGKMNV